MPIHRTAIDDISLSPEGWAAIGGGCEITRLPLRDTAHRLEDDTTLFARLTHRTAKAFAAANGYELPGRGHLIAARARGITIEPTVIVPHTQSLEGSMTHDRRVWAKLRAAHWDSAQPVTGAGKHHLAGAPKGRAYLMGWWTERLEWYTPPAGEPGHRAGPGWIQEGAVFGPGPHSDAIFGYATTSMLVRRVTDAAPDTQPDPSCPPDIGLALLQRARADLGVRETAPNTGPRIREYFAPFGLTAGNWCAVAIAAWLREACAMLGVSMPIEGSASAQATRDQLISAGLFVLACDLTDAHLVPGNIVVWRRGPPPPHPDSWWGHIAVLRGYDSVERMLLTIDGNSGAHGDLVAEMSRTRDDPRLLGVGVLSTGHVCAPPWMPTAEQLEEAARLVALSEAVWEGSDPLS